jgi:hypothetical protein
MQAMQLDYLEIEPQEHYEGRGLERLWCQAIMLYMQDAANCLRLKNPKGHEIEALDDLLGSGALLARLCLPLDLDAKRLAKLMLDRLNSGEPVRHVWLH